MNTAEGQTSAAGRTTLRGDAEGEGVTRGEPSVEDVALLTT
ncbi:hypothetical protein ACFQX6_40845 [Streptosporangium lutulentum]